MHADPQLAVGMVLDGVGLLALACVIVLGAALLVVGRGRLLRHRGATIECSLRAPYGEAWQLGVGRYDGDALRFYRSFGTRLRPDAVIRRRGLAIDVRRCPVGTEAATLHLSGAAGGVEILQCTDSEGRRVELGLPHELVPGFMAWLESVPPGTHV